MINLMLVRECIALGAEMELRDYLTILWRRKWVVIATLLMTEIVVVVATVKTTPVFTASTLLRIATSTRSSFSYTDSLYADRLMNTYVKLATTKPVLDELKQRLGLTYLPGIGVEIISETELLQIQVEDQDPVLAAKVANTLANILISQSGEKYTGNGKSTLDILNEQLSVTEKELNQTRKEYTVLATQTPNDADALLAAKQAVDSKQQIYNAVLQEYEQALINSVLRENSISVVDPAVAPTSPSRPSLMMNIALGVLVGLLGGVGLIFLFENLDTTLYTTEQIEKVTKLPSLGAVPNANIRDRLISSDGNTPYGDAFWRLRSNLFALQQDSPHQTLLVTSAEPGEGKSTLVTNLAFILAQAGRTVVVIDCDLRRPTLHKIFELQNEKGLSDILLKKNDFEEVLQGITVPDVKIVTSGPIPSNPVGLLGSQQMSSLINDLRQNYDYVLLDSPALLSVSDAVVLAPAVDGVILVVGRSSSHREAVLSACKQLTEVKAHILGAVINRAGRTRAYYYTNGK
jgi:non-specific protein-tyrosine kinase